MDYYIIMAAIGGALVAAGYNKVNNIKSFSEYERGLRSAGLDFPSESFQSSYASHVEEVRGQGKFFIGLGAFILVVCVLHFA
ncbi:MAG: hypothetical protein V4607_01960 [Pseudomonadota bacterium]